jgi:tRNA threonylcarbamoyl adenosine modification protein (Sua5/YciO/YrdC/YwlC family)
MYNQSKTILLNPGSVGVIATDTVYGLVARASDVSAVARLYKLKSRENKPGTVIAASALQLEDLGIKHKYLKAVEQYWPGAVSVILPLSDLNLNYLSQDQMTLAVRIPDKKELVDLLEITGPLLTSSANMPGKPPANNIKEAKAYFEDEVDFYEDGGDLSDHQPSTIIRIIDDAVEVVRQGSASI